MNPVQDIEQALRSLVAPGQVTELRAIKVIGSKRRFPYTESGFFDSDHLHEMAMRAWELSKDSQGVYFTPNPLRPDLLARCANRTDVLDTGLLAKDDDVIARKWLLVDFDPERPSGVSSSDEEKDYARHLAVESLEYLRKGGWPTPAIADSGNGFHLLYRLDLPNDEPSRDLVRRVLIGLSSILANDRVHVDAKVFNAARIVKLYGTLSRKGDSTPERPHRRSQFLELPGDGVVTQKQLEVVAIKAEDEPAVPFTVTDTMGDGITPTGGDPVERARQYLARMDPAIAGQNGHNTTYRAACALVQGFALSVEQALPLLREWNQRCEPPWEDHELLHKLNDAVKDPAPRGELLASQPAKPASGAEMPRANPDAFGEMFRRLKIQVLGEYENSDVEVFSEDRHKVVRIKASDVPRLSLTTAYQHFGRPALEHLYDGKEPVPGMIPVDSLAKAIAFEAGKRRIVQRNYYGTGCWPGEDGGVLLVSSGEAWLWKDGFQRITSPFVGSKLLDLSAPAPWFDRERLEADVKQARDGMWRFSVFHDLIDLTKQWRWKHRHDPLLAASLILCSYVQTLWQWRPMVAVLGASNTGKSFFFDELFKPLLGDLCVEFEKPSEAGLRQTLRHHALVALLDEFERDKHRAQLLELFRASSRGGYVVRGTATQRAQQFYVRHIFWVAATETGLKKEPDKNRFITLELQRPEGKTNTLKMPERSVLTDLGAKLLALSLASVDGARTHADWLKAQKYPCGNRRIVESYSVPLGMIAAVLGYTQDSAYKLMCDVLGDRDFGNQTRDEHDLIGAILTSEVVLGGGERLSVSQLLAVPHGDNNLALQRCGLKLTRPKKGDRELCLFIAPDPVQRSLLKGTDWADAALDQLLLRLEGSRRMVVDLGSKSFRGIGVPMATIEGAFSGSDEEEPQEAQGLVGEAQGEKALWEEDL